MGLLDTSNFLPDQDQINRNALYSGLLAGAFGLLTGNRNQPLNTIGKAGLLGVGGYGAGLALGQNNAQKDFEQKVTMYKLQKEQEAMDAFQKLYGTGSTPTSSGADAPQPGAGGGPQNGPTLEQIGALTAISPERGKAALELWKAQNPGMQVSNGYAYNPRTIQPGFVPGINVSANGQAVVTTVDPATGQPRVSAPPGAVDAYSQFRSADETARANLDLVPVPQSDGSTRYMPRSEAIRLLGPQKPDTPQAPQPSPNALELTAPDDASARALAQKFESQGIPVRVRVVSPQSQPAPPQAGTVPGIPGAPPVKVMTTAPQLGVSQSPAAQKEAGLQVERDFAQPTARAAYNDAYSGLSRLEAATRQLMNHEGLSGITGKRGALPDIPGTDAANARAKLETLKSQVGFSVLQAMRNASPTGGALGQVSDRENTMLQNNLAALNTAQSKEEFKAQLQNLIDYVKGAQGRMKSAYDSMYSSPEQVSPSQPSSNTIRYDAQGRRI